MSYNILKKNVKFSGPADGTIEGMIDVSSSQEIVGDKTFASTITSSADVMLSGSGKVSASFFYGDGSSLSGVSGVPAGTDGNIQFTDGSALGASSNLTFFTSSNKLEVLGEISASVNVSASAFYGNGSNLTNVAADSILAQNIVGKLSASQISHSSGLTNDGDDLVVDLANNGGLLENSGLKLDISLLQAAGWSSDNDTVAVHTGGSTKKMPLSTIGDNIFINASNIDTGTLSNLRLPTTISASVLSASIGISGAFFEGDGSGLTGVTGTPTPGGANTEIQFNDDGVLTGAPDLTFSTASFTLATVNISASGYVTASSYAIEGGTIIDANADITCGNITMQDGVGTLNFGDNEVSGSGNISGSQFYGDGSTLSNLPVGTYSNYTENRILAAGGASDEIKGLSAVTFNNPTLNVVGNVSASINISASAFYGDGSNLQNISATPQYRYQYINSVVKLNTNLVTANSFQLFPADADGIAQSSDRTTHFVMPGSGSIERVIMSPSFYNTNGSGANVFTTSHSPQFFVRKNDISDGTPISGIALQMTASSANMKPLDLPNNAGTLNTQVVIFDVANNSPVITGSNSFDPGDILIFSGRNDVVVSDVAITIVFKIEEAGVTYP